MPTRTEPWPTGTPCWVDLTTPDVPAKKIVDNRGDRARGAVRRRRQRPDVRGARLAGRCLRGWQPGDVFGIEIYNEPGALVWNEAAVPDPEAGRRFYAEVFGYTYQPIEGATDTAVATAQQRGATILGDPIDTPYGRMAVIIDPHGATFAIIGVTPG